MTQHKMLKSILLYPVDHYQSFWCHIYTYYYFQFTLVDPFTIMMAVSALALTLPPTHESTNFLAISLGRDLENGGITSV